MSDPEPAGSCVSGDVSQPIELQVGYRTSASFMAAGAAPWPIPLSQAFQGGQVLYIGIRARNIDGCSATINTALVDPQTRSVVSLEHRPIFFEMGGDGWLQPRQPNVASNYSNLPACPRANLDRSIDGETYELQVSVTDANGRTGETSLAVIPTCTADAAYSTCHCQCAKGYTLGMTCN